MVMVLRKRQPNLLHIAGTAQSQSSFVGLKHRSYD